MAESWQDRRRREAREMFSALQEAFAKDGEDVALRSALETLATKPQFSLFTWYWGPRLAQRNRVLFRPFTLAHFNAGAVDARGEPMEPWRGSEAADLEKWFQQVDAADDIELARRLHGWRLSRIKDWKEQAASWREDVVRRFTGAASPAARVSALAKLDGGWNQLDGATAEKLFACDPAASRAFILRHLPWFGPHAEKLVEWERLLTRSRERQPEFHFDLYRRIIEPPQWRVDVLKLAGSVRDAGELDAELERRHPQRFLTEAGEVFFELVRARGRDAVPYVIRHAGSVYPRWAMLGFLGRKREGKALPDLLALAREQDWLDLYSALLRTSATAELFDAEVLRLAKSTAWPDAEVRRRLTLIAGPGREANFAGFSWTQVQPLQDETALVLYRRFPDLVRGPYAMHVAPTWQSAYPQMVAEALRTGDTELIDYFASRAAMYGLSHYGDNKGWKQTMPALTRYFEAMPESEFVVAAASALGRMPAFAIWSYERLLGDNPLARLLFERSTPLYLSQPRCLRDLLESPQIHVQVLGLRILAQRDPRAAEAAAANADLLQATLFRPLHRRTRLIAFAALENAALHDEPTARFLLGRMRDALALPERRYPTERLVGLIAQVLHRYPALRGPREQPRVFAEARA